VLGSSRSPYESEKHPPTASDRPGRITAALGFNLNANRFDSPETRGERFKSHVEPLSFGGSGTFFAVPDLTANPVQINTPSFDRSNLSYRLSGGMGVFEDLDMDLKLSWNGPVMLQLKYQILGEHELQTRSGNFAVAISGAAGLALPSGDVTNSGSGINGKYDLQFTSYDLALIAGERLTEIFMVYGGPFITSISYSGKITQTGPVTTSLPLNGNVTQSGVNLGVQFDSVLASVKVEEAWALAGASGNSKAGFYTGLSFSYRF
jgi:hypothetical protein